MPSRRHDGHQRHRRDELLVQHHDPVHDDGQHERHRKPERQRQLHDAQHHDGQRQHRHDDQQHDVDGRDGHGFGLGLDERLAQLHDDAGVDDQQHQLEQPRDGRIDEQHDDRQHDDAEHRHHDDEVMMRLCTLALVAAMSLGLAACQRAKQDTGDMTAGRQAPTGASGKGTNAMGGPGSGLAGGMNPAPGQPTGVAEGTSNSTTKSTVGNR